MVKIGERNNRLRCFSTRCNGQARYLLKIYLTDAENQELEFYFLDLSGAQKLFLDVELVSGEKMH
ncbi:MAG: hypothetical protein PWQ22_900 [Archaeoglobaceae archaeon]|nr:hypothetical protein [Archaeoglobaceae archaeon]MDK2876490.1 hypothetical protein [Archaeoglobaceae archaeon]